MKIISLYQNIKSATILFGTLILASGIGMGSTAAQSGTTVGPILPTPSSPGIAPPNVPQTPSHQAGGGATTAQSPSGCSNVAARSDPAQQMPGSGQMTTSPTGMMTDSGRQQLPCPPNRP
jgi:hypothetical protein